MLLLKNGGQGVSMWSVHCPVETQIGVTQQSSAQQQPSIEVVLAECLLVTLAIEI